MSHRNLTRRAVLGGLAAAGACASPFLRALAKGDGAGLEEPQAVQVNARALPHFHRLDPQARRFGTLEYRGGLVLTSPARRFCEWSGLVTDADGSRLLAISDEGSWMSAQIAYGEDGAPVGLARAVAGPLLDARGRPLGGEAGDDKKWQDAESIALVDGSIEEGTVLIGFERMHRITRCAVRGGQVQAPSALLRMPPDVDRLGYNTSFEAVAVLRAGPLTGAPIAFAERYIAEPGYHTGWIWVDGEPRRIQLQDTDGFDITDAAGMEDGGLLILERSYDPHADARHRTRMRIRHLKASEIEPGARLAGRTVMQADADYEIDNMEGLAIHRGARGETVLTLISDDNRNPSQRTVFLQFTLLE